VIRRREAIGGLLGGLLTLPALADDGETVYRSSPPSPRGRVFSATPELLWPAFPSGERQVTRVTLQVGTRELPARFEAKRGVVGKPETALPTGEHEAKAEIFFDDGWHATIRWRFTVAPKPASAPAPQVQASEMLTQVNEIRRSASLPPMLLDPRLCWAATRHSEWQRKNNIFGHYQKPGTSGFFGESAEDRATACGFAEGVYEGVHMGEVTPREAIRDLFYAPYHRLAFLQPDAVAFGGGVSGQFTTALCEGTTTNAVVTWPAAGQKNAPLSWQGEEIPHPLRMHGQKSSATVGTVISFSYFSPEMDEISVTSAAVWGPDGELVPLYLNTPQNDTELQNAAFVIPQKPLKPSTQYTVSVLAKVVRTGTAIHRQWTFTTAAK
jgi:hypothetical protein